MNGKKICMVVPSLSGGGAERVVSVLATALAELGKDVFIIIHRHAKIAEYEISEKVHVCYLDDGKYSKNKFIARSQRVLAVRKYLIDNKIDVVVPFLDSCMKHTFLATRGLKIRFVSTLRNNPYERTKQESRSCDHIARKADANFVQNDMQKEYFPSKVQEKTFVVPNPVSRVFFLGERVVRPEIEKIVAIGRLMDQKNYPRLLAAMAIVRKSRPGVKLSIYGVGELESALEKMIVKKGLGDCVQLCGRTDNVTEVLSENDLFVMSSDYEGMPNALMEAMAFGMPCVSTDCPTGPAGLIGDNERGMLAKLDNGEDLAQKIMFMMENTELAREKGKKAREYMKAHYSEDAIAKEFYDKCTAF
jgi:glycosyltransferase involved in cell wall biosynthesis